MLMFFIVLTVLADTLVESDPLTIKVALTQESTPAVFTLETALKATY